MVGDDVREWRKLASFSVASTAQACWPGLFVIRSNTHDGDKLSTAIIHTGQVLTHRTGTPGRRADGWLMATTRDT